MSGAFIVVQRRAVCRLMHAARHAVSTIHAVASQILAAAFTGASYASPRSRQPHSARSFRSTQLHQGGFWHGIRCRRAAGLGANHHIDSDGLETGAVGVRGADGVLVPAYRAQPKGKTHLPVIIVIHEILGMHEHIADGVPAPCEARLSRHRAGPVHASGRCFCVQIDAATQRATRVESAGFAGDFRYRSDRQMGGRITWLYATRT